MPKHLDTIFLCTAVALVVGFVILVTVAPAQTLSPFATQVETYAYQ